MLIFYITVINCFSLVNTQDSAMKTIMDAGYRAELHTVMTEDSYILNLHRIPAANPTLKIVLIVHGLLTSGQCFTIIGPGIPKHSSIAFYLADNDYDVWLANVRGTVFSRGHKHFQANSSKYWKFSFHEIAKYDLPAMINYILMKTHQSSLHYVGHSQGTTVIMAMLSMFPNYNKKLKTLHLMAPSIYFQNSIAYAKALVMFLEPLQDAVEALDIGEAPMVNMDLRRLGGYLCSSKSPITLEICKQIMFLFLGPSQHINEALFIHPIPTYIFVNMPNIASIMQLIHYGQLIKSGGGRFLQYDHHREGNILIYNQSTPSEYKLANVNVKIHFLYGTTDRITSDKDVERLMSEFKSSTIGIDRLVGYNHFDFLAAKDVNKLVNKNILDLMNRFN